MKALKIFGIVLLVCFLLIAAGLFIFIKTFNVNRYKPQIISLAQKALGRDVAIGDIALGLSLRTGVSVNLKGFRIAEDPAFGTGDFLSVENVSVGIDAWQYVTKRTISMPYIQVQAPNVAIIRGKDGSINAQTMGKKSQGAPVPAAEGEKQVPSVGPSAIALPLLFVGKASIDNGVITYTDRAVEPAVSLEVTQVSLVVEKVSLTDAFPFETSAALFSNQKNVSAKGMIQVNKDTLSVRVSDTDVSVDVSKMVLEKILASFPALSGAGLENPLTGILSLTVHELEAGEKGLTALSADGAVSGATIKFKQLAIPLGPLTLTLKLTATDATTNDILLKIGEGNASGQASINNYLTTQDVKAKVDFTAIDAGKLIDQSKQQVKFAGLVSGNIDATATGLSADKLLPSLASSGSANVKDGRLIDINILKTALDKIAIIPDLTERIRAGLPERYQQVLTQKDTIISKASANLEVKDSVAHINDMIAEADGFLFEGKGSVDFNQKYEVAGTVYIPEDLSAAMAKIVKELSYFFDGKNRILIPLVVSGTGSKVSVMVDLKYLSQKVFENQGKIQLQKVLDKALGVKDTGAPQDGSSGTPQGEQPAQQQGQNETILDMLFKKL